MHSDVVLEALIKPAADAARAHVNAQVQQLGELTGRLEAIGEELSQNQENVLSLNPLQKQSGEAKRVMLMEELSNVAEQRKRMLALSDHAKRELEKQIVESRIKCLTECDIVFATATGAGSEALSHQKFDWLIVDDANRMSELSTLVPLRRGIKACVLIGDSYSDLTCQSLFTRMQTAKIMTYTLGAQYRMHPGISVVVDTAILDHGKIPMRDAPPLSKRLPPPWESDDRFKALILYDVGPNESRPQGSQPFTSIAEADAVCTIYKELRRCYPAGATDSRIVVLSPFAAQQQILRARFAGSAVEVSTVDEYQGREQDIVIYSVVTATVGAKPIKRDFGLVLSGLTRARLTLFIVGNLSSLRGVPEWAKVLSITRQMNLVRPIANVVQASVPVARNPSTASQRPVSATTAIEPVPATSGTALGGTIAPRLGLFVPNLVKQERTSPPRDRVERDRNCRDRDRRDSDVDRHRDTGNDRLRASNSRRDSGANRDRDTGNDRLRDSNSSRRTDRDRYGDRDGDRHRYRERYPHDRHSDDRHDSRHRDSDRHHEYSSSRGCGDGRDKHQQRDSDRDSRRDDQSASQQSTVTRPNSDHTNSDMDWLAHAREFCREYPRSTSTSAIQSLPMTTYVPRPLPPGPAN
eukprot:TRINITY_DN2233_c0_g1_i4.p1 TRINITY_DN2233_c0_g1~~TRINITY_DN2233_c0_g1_i4.p1  ORF type:complete len:637 (+),score=87.94 TRINITY_DN2233_c0_g1_i4:212-2122(+)